MFSSTEVSPRPTMSRSSTRVVLHSKLIWERDARVRVTLRPLKYDYQRDTSGALVVGPDGKRLARGKPREKGVDVLCALALVREVAKPDVDVVILASRDSDLQPALDEALLLESADLETTTWYDPDQPGRCRPLRPGDTKRRLWNTALREADFQLCWDRNSYD